MGKAENEILFLYCDHLAVDQLQKGQSYSAETARFHFRTKLSTCEHRFSGLYYELDVGQLLNGHSIQWSEPAHDYR